MKEDISLKTLIEKNDINAVKKILNIKDYTNNWIYYFKIACKKNYSDIAELILDKEDLNISNDYFIDLCIIRGNIDIIKLLINHSKSKNNINTNAILIKACGYGKLNLVNYLLSENIDPSKLNNAAFHIANKKNNNDILNILWKDLRVQKILKNENIHIHKEFSQKYMKKNINNF